MALAFLWEHFGPAHHDRLQAVHNAGHCPVAIELFARSAAYDWQRDHPPEGSFAPPFARSSYTKVTLAPDRRQIGVLRLAWRIVRSVRRADPQAAFLCHYNEPAVFVAAIILRLSGIPAVTMLDSKADDRRRPAVSSLLRRAMLMPYCAALVAGPRSADYAAELGMAPERIALHYNTLDIAALRAAGQGAGAGAGAGGRAGDSDEIPYADRPFLIVARLIPEKNLGAALRGFARFRALRGGPRRLVIIGEGPERSELTALAQQLGIARQLDWRGACNRAEIARAMRASLALILPSIRETYGLVVIEALAQGLVPIVSARAGAVDLLIDDRSNGFVIDPDNPGTICDAMLALDESERCWRRMASRAALSAERADTRHFVESVERLARSAKRQLWNANSKPLPLRGDEDPRP